MKNLKIVRVPIPTPTLWPHQTTNCYLIGTEKESILVDAGYDQEVTRTELQKALQMTGMAQPQSIILTHYHPDHAPGVNQLSEWNPTIYCHSYEFEAIQRTISPTSHLETVSVEEPFLIDQHKINLLHTPGHTKGHLSLYVPSKKTLIAGDNIVAEGTSWIGPPDGDMADFLNTLAALKQLDLERIGPGHGDWVTNPYEHIDFVMNRRLEREVQIQDLLLQHERLTATNLTNMIYQGSIHPSVFEVAKRTTEAHLIKLIQDGVVVQENDTYRMKS